MPESPVQPTFLLTQTKNYFQESGISRGNLNTRIKSYSHLTYLMQLFFPFPLILNLFLPTLWSSSYGRNNNNESKSCRLLSILGPWWDITMAFWLFYPWVQALYWQKPENLLVLWWHLVVRSAISSACSATGVHHGVAGLCPGQGLWGEECWCPPTCHRASSPQNKCRPPVRRPHSHTDPVTPKKRSLPNYFPSPCSSILKIPFLRGEKNR